MAKKDMESMGNMWTRGIYAQVSANAAPCPWPTLYHDHEIFPIEFGFNLKIFLNIVPLVRTAVHLFRY